MAINFEYVIALLKLERKKELATVIYVKPLHYVLMLLTVSVLCIVSGLKIIHGHICDPSNALLL